MRLPSSSSEPNASASPVAQSMPLAAFDHCLLGFELAAIARMHVEPGRHARQRRADLLQRDFGDGGGFLLPFELDVRRMEAGPVALQPVRLVRLVGLRRLVGRLHRSLELVPHRLRFRRRHDALRRQSFGVQRARGLLAGDRAIHHRLGERRLVGLVVAVASVADDVQHDVGGEPHAEFGRHARAEHHRLGVVAVDVQDRRLDRLRHVGAIQPGIGVRRHGGEADLVVDDHMHGAAGAVADQLAHRQCLIHQALAGERRVAVHQDRHHRTAPLRVARGVLPRAHLAHHDRVHRLQMRRIGLQRDVHAASGDVHVGRGAEVVFDVARALHIVGLEALAAELGEHRGERLLHDVDQRVEPAAMRHADGDLVDALRGHRLDHRVQRRNGDLAAFQPEPLGGDVALLAEHLEALGLGELLEYAALLRRAEGRVPRRAFHPALDPGFLVGILDVHELDADRAAIGVAQDPHDLAQRGGLAAEHVVDEDRLVQVGVGEAVGKRVQLGVRRRNGQPERVEPRLEMAAHAVGADQHQGAQRGDGGGADLLAGQRRRTAAWGGSGPRGIVCFRRGIARRPGGAGGVLQHRAGVVVQRTEQLGEGRIDGRRVGRPARVLLAQERGVGAAEGRCEDVNASHRSEPLLYHR